MIADVIVTWPRNCDYPLWRQMIRSNRPRFNEVIIAFHETNQGHDYREFVKNAMFADYIHTLPAPVPRPGEDWRNLAINAALLHSYNAPWIWFTEQDFYPGEGFWREVGKLEDEGNGVIAVYQQDRMHPCCIFVKREVLERTRKNFGIIPDKADHFSLFQEDIKNMGYKVGILPPGCYQHLNGLSHNWKLATEGLEPNYHKDEFVAWLLKCFEVSVPQDVEFLTIASAVIERNPTPPTPSPTENQASFEAREGDTL